MDKNTVCATPAHSGIKRTARRRLYKAAVCLLLVIAILTAAVGTVTVSSADSVEYYGRTALAALPNSEALLYAYDRLVEGVGKSEEKITVYNGKDSITIDEMRTVFQAYRCDHVEHFWLDVSTYAISHDNTTVQTFAPIYTMSGAELAEAKADFEKAAENMMKGISDSMSEFEREKLLHDRLAEHVSYSSTGTDAHSAYGALVKGETACEGYAGAFAYLLRKAGIQSFLVTGSSISPETGKAEGHAWNLVRINGKYYHIDLTWDDQSVATFYAYFNKSDAEMSEDHAVAENGYSLPACSSDDADYFTVYGGKLAEFDTGAAAGLLKAGDGTAHVYVTGSREDFINSYCDNAGEVAASLGLVSYQYSYIALGREIIFSMVPTTHTISFNANGGSGSMSDVTNVRSGAYTLPANGFTPPSGKQFVGWAASASGSVITDGTYTVARDITFYAIWEQAAHVHKYGTEWVTDAEKHWHECVSCYEKTDAVVHKFVWKTDVEATVTATGKKHEECTVCGYEKSAVETDMLAPDTSEKEPDASTLPDTSKEKPDISEGKPEVSKEPVVSVTPDASEEPEMSVTPDASEEPEVSVPADVSEKEPKLSVSADISEEPESSVTSDISEKEQPVSERSDGAAEESGKPAPSDVRMPEASVPAEAETAVSVSGPTGVKPWVAVVAAVLAAAAVAAVIVVRKKAKTRNRRNP